MESAREKDNLFRQLKDKTPDMEVSMKSAVQQAELQTAKDDIARLRNELQNKDGKLIFISIFVKRETFTLAHMLFSGCIVEF